MVALTVLTYCAFMAGVMPTLVSDPKVRTITLRNAEDFMLPPVVRLAAADQLRLSFDIIGEDRDHLRYRLVHCNADWTPSRLLEHEYLDGFNEGEIDDFAYSSNTYIHYVNYNLQLPNDSISPIKSGNYLIQVYREDEPDVILFQTGFYVTENSVAVSGISSTRTDRGFNTEWQQMEITVDAKGNEITNPWQDYVLRVVQNNDPLSIATAYQPLRVEGDKTVYSHNPNLIFPAGNEYRRFETVRADYPGMHVDSVEYKGGIHYAYLTPDFPRADKPYTYDRTQHGRYKIDEYNSTDADLGADYVMTCFTLVMPEMKGKNVYVDGEFARYLPPGSNRMRYNSEKGVYEVEIPLKQGSYNYRYAAGEDTSRSSSEIEGNHYETSNDYTVLIYLREPGSRGDRLISVTTD